MNIQEIFEENPWTISLALILGVFTALILPSPLQDFLSSNTLENVTEDPTGTLTGYVIGMPIAMIGEAFVKIISGLIGGIIGMIIGLFVDSKSKNNHFGGYY